MARCAALFDLAAASNIDQALCAPSMAYAGRPNTAAASSKKPRRARWLQNIIAATGLCHYGAPQRLSKMRFWAKKYSGAEKTQAGSEPPGPLLAFMSATGRFLIGFFRKNPRKN